MKVTLAFGRTGAEVTIPSHIEARVLEAKFAQALPAADEAPSIMKKPMKFPLLKTRYARQREPPVPLTSADSWPWLSESKSSSPS